MKNIILTLTLITSAFYTLSQEQVISVSSENKTLIFMEEQIQNVNTIQADRGSGYTGNVKEEIFSSGKNEDKLQKLETVIYHTERIDTETSKLIEYIDQIKYELIKDSKENIKSIVSKERDGVYPDKLNLYNLVSPSVKAEIKDSIKLYRRIVTYRDSLIFHCSNYEWNSKSYRLPVIGTIRNYSTAEEFYKLLNAKFDVETYNYNEDKYVLRDLYLQLHSASMKVIDQRNATLITNLCLLSALQQDILSSRALAMANWKSKVSTGEYSFDSISTLVDGPETVKTGALLTYKVYYAAIDSEQKPEIVVSSPKGVIVTYNEDGTYSLDITPENKGTINLSGTLTVTNKSGIKRTENWEKSIVVE